MGEVVSLLRYRYVPNTGAILKSAILNLSQFFKMERGRVIYQITSAFSAKLIPVNIFEVAFMVQKLQHILLRYLKMASTTEERIEVILMSGERSFRVIAAYFNKRHEERLPI